MESSNKLGVTAATGFKAVGVACGLKKTGALDLALVASDEGCSTAGVFTTNRVKAAPVLYDQELLCRNRDSIRAVIANSGCANACTGEIGLKDARDTASAVAGAIGCQADQVLVLSTGVIGVRLNMDKIHAGIANASKYLSYEGGTDAADAIMTTDTRHKISHRQFNDYAIGGMAKGAGMIHPNMATMLSVITTDAKIAPDLLDRALHTAVNQSFNRISVDGDMSTNDTLLILASGASGKEIKSKEEFENFTDGLSLVARDLAKQVARDGEGATKFVELDVTGALEEADAVRVARSIANSPLVKTAIYGSDANWGRVVCAAGYSGVAVEPGNMKLWFGDVLVFSNGTATNYREQDSAAALAGTEISIHLDLGMGNASTKVWTCDLSHDYVTINGKYRT